MNDEEPIIERLLRNDMFSLRFTCNRRLSPFFEYEPEKSAAVPFLYMYPLSNDGSCVFCAYSASKLQGPLFNVARTSHAFTNLGRFSLCVASTKISSCFSYLFTQEAPNVSSVSDFFNAGIHSFRATSASAPLTRDLFHFQYLRCLPDRAFNVTPFNGFTTSLPPSKELSIPNERSS